MIILILKRVSIPFHRPTRSYKKLMPKEFQFFDSYEDYVMNYLTQIKCESDGVFDMLSHKNTKFLFFINPINI